MGGNPCYSLCWLILLFLIAWPISFIMAPIWLLLMPLEACCPIFSDINGYLEKFVKWPRDVGSAIANCSSNCPQP